MLKATSCLIAWKIRRNERRRLGFDFLGPKLDARGVLGLNIGASMLPDRAQCKLLNATTGRVFRNLLQHAAVAHVEYEFDVSHHLCLFLTNTTSGDRCGISVADIVEVECANECCFGVH